MRRARGRAAREASAEGLSLPQFQLLASFLTDRDDESWSVGSLAEAAGLASPTATRMLDALERDGIVERHRSSEDRRCVSVSLTPRGRELLRHKRERVAAKRRTIYESLTPAERRQTEALLRRLAGEIEKL